MGKDAEGPCCESCRQFGGEDAVLPEPAPPMASRVAAGQIRILVSQKGGPTSEVTPTGTEVNVGRVSGNDVVLRDGTISKRQCRFVFKDGKVLVQDLKSSCGTYLDGRKVDVAVVGEGSVVSVGDFELRITSRDR